jgi:hypothetical protein
MNESDFIERELNLLMDEMSNLHINEFNFDDYAEEEESAASTDGECVCGESGELCFEGSECLDEDLEGEEDFEDTEEDPQAFLEE